jgi:hypothetical protein
VDDARPSQSNLIRLLWGLVVLLVLALVALLSWQVAGGGDDDKPAEAPTRPPGAARIVSPAELREATASAAMPVYWAGPRSGAKLELSESGKARVYVRYLTGGAGAGDSRPAFLTVGTYRSPGALEALRVNAKQSGVELRKAPRGAFAWVDPQRPNSVYLARAGQDFQVEVYDPSPRIAWSVALSPRLRPVAPG